MNLMFWNRKRAIITLAICAMLAVSSIMLLQMSQTTEAAVIDPHPGLVGWWRFDEGAGDVATDSSGYGNDGAIYGGAGWADGKYGKALNLDGLDDYVRISNDFSGGLDSLTLMAWVKGERASSLFYAPSAVVILHFRGAGFYLKSEDSTTSGYLNWNPYPSEDVWVHIAATWDSQTGKMNLYVNGVKQVSEKDFTGGSTETLASSSFLDLGNHFNLAQSFFKGLIDEVRIYNRALTEFEVQKIYSEKPDFSSNLLAKIPKGTNQIITTISWQGTGSLNVTLQSPTEIYTEEDNPVYEKTSYDTSADASILNIKRLSVSISALATDESWQITLQSENVEDYKISVEIQR